MVRMCIAILCVCFYSDSDIAALEGRRRSRETEGRKEGFALKRMGVGMTHDEPFTVVKDGRYLD